MDYIAPPITYAQTDRTFIEPWVDANTVAVHLGFSADHVRKMAGRGEIPGKLFKNGKREFWRFRITDIDAALSAACKPILRINMPAFVAERA